VRRGAATTVLLLASVFALASCGGGGGSGDDGDRVEITEAIVDSWTTSYPADCEHLYTQAFLEQSTKRQGEAALKECESLALREVGELAESVSVSGIDVDGNTAGALAAIEGSSLDGQTMEIALAREGGRWKLDQLVRFVELNEAMLVAGLGAELLELSRSELEGDYARCVVEQLEGLSGEALEELFLGPSLQPLFDLVAPCERGSSAPQAL
jgi:hypothetical protein